MALHGRAPQVAHSHDKPLRALRRGIEGSANTELPPATPSTWPGAWVGALLLLLSRSCEHTIAGRPTGSFPWAAARIGSHGTTDASALVPGRSIMVIQGQGQGQAATAPPPQGCSSGCAGLPILRGDGHAEQAQGGDPEEEPGPGGGRRAGRQPSRYVQSSPEAHQYYL